LAFAMCWFAVLTLAGEVSLHLGQLPPDSPRSHPEPGSHAHRFAQSHPARSHLCRHAPLRIETRHLTCTGAPSGRIHLCGIPSVRRLALTLQVS
jgi:hypothetical protein